MARTYKIIDADGHILEPVDIWDRYMDPAYRDRAPRMVLDDNGKEARSCRFSIARPLSESGGPSESRPTLSLGTPGRIRTTGEWPSIATTPRARRKRRSSILGKAST